MGIRDRLAKRASQPGGNGDYADFVKFDDPGQEVAGVVSDTRTAESDYGEFFVVEVEEAEVSGLDGVEDGEDAAIPCTNHQLKVGLEEGDNALGRKVEKGDLVYVRYEGKAQTAKGNTVKNYAIAVEDPEADGEDVPF